MNRMAMMIKTRKTLSLLVLALFACFPLCAQETIFDHLTRQQVGDGTVTIHQDSRLKELVGKVRSYSPGAQKTAQKVQGFRVQVYAGNNSQQARSEAAKVAEKVKTLFPDLDVYTQFVSPRWLCRVGDYRSIEEADAIMRLLKKEGEFKEVSIVRSLIKL